MFALRKRQLDQGEWTHSFHTRVVLLQRRSTCPNTRLLKSPPLLSSGLSSLRSLSEALPSTSRVPLQASQLHTSSAVQLTPQQTPRHRKLARQKRQHNLDKQELKRRLAELSKPDPVLGHQTNEKGEERWKSCELAGLLLDKDVVWGVKEDRRGNLVPILEDPNVPEAVEAARKEERSQAEKEGGPLRLNFGLTLTDRKTLFGHLPTIVAEDNVLNAHAVQLARGDAGALRAAEEDLEKMEQAEKLKTDTLSRILDLRNASARGIQVENVRRIINHFGNRGPRLPRDTGSVEVQGASLGLDRKASSKTTRGSQTRAHMHRDPAPFSHAHQRRS